MKGLSLELNEELKMWCDNKQTIRLLTEQIARFQTKLRHVDIYSHWLRQEVQRNHIQVIWTPTAKMVADGLTKPLGKEAFSMFRTAAGLEVPPRPTIFYMRINALRIMNDKT